jgi:1,4-alpha-glucan branching enzyme
MPNHKDNKINGHGPTAQFVHIEFNHPTARAVAIAGTFNDWRPQATRMVALGAGRWLKRLVLPRGRHEYLFVVDGRWIPDPSAHETVPNPCGGVNSVLRVSAQPEVNHGTISIRRRRHTRKA